jgi:hypothetical protein
MPALDGKLSPEEIEHIKEWVDGKRAKACSVCEGALWSVGEHLVAPVTLAGRNPIGLNLGGILYPVAQIICTSCGHTQYFNAVVMNLLPGVEDPKAKSAQEAK